MTKNKQSNKRKSTGAVKTCGDCGTVIEPTVSQIRCDQCKKSFHAECKNIAERVCRKLNRDKTPWLCDTYDDSAIDDPHDGENDESEDFDNESFKGILTDINKKLSGLTKKCNDLPSLKKKCSDIANECSEIAKSQQYLSDAHDNLIAQIKRCTDENKQLRSEVTALTNKCSFLAKELDQIKSQVNTHEQAKLSYNVLVRGINIDDDPMQAVLKIATLIEMHEKIENSITVKRLSYQNREPVIVITFTDEQLKQQFVKEAKKKRISTLMFSYEGESKPIYVDEQLTRDTFLLFKYAKKLKKVGCTYIWIANGDIMSRVNSTAPFVKIKRKQQVDKIERELIMKKQATQQSSDNSNHNERRAERIPVERARTNQGTAKQTNDNKQQPKTKHTRTQPSTDDSVSSDDFVEAT